MKYYELTAAIFAFSRAVAKALPTPPAPPVINATLPSISMVSGREKWLMYS